MALGDGIRRNIASVDPSERDLLRDAFIEMNRRFFPGTRTDSPPGGVSWWFKQDEIHQATHVHGGAEFLPWHRVICNRIEELLRQIDPRLSLHYWDFNEDPSSLFTTPTDDPLHYFMGSGSGVAGEPWLGAGFYDPDAGDPGHPEDRDSASGTPADPPTDISRGVTAAALLPIGDISPGSAFGIICPAIPITNDDDITSAEDFSEFRVRLECVHNFAHGHVGGTLNDPHISFRDPIVFLLHSNVDRIFARWQTDPAHSTRLEPQNVYGADSGDSEINNDVEPWSGGASTRPWSAPESQGVPFNYKHPSVVAPPCYDTNHSFPALIEVVNTGTPPVINFNDIPEGETAARAASFRVYGCRDVTIKVKTGFGPAAPFSILYPLDPAFPGDTTHGSITVEHTHSLYTEARIWLAYTAGASGVPVADGPVTFECVETGQEFTFTIKANAIVKPTVAVMLSLDQSGSMNWDAGTSGLKRIDVLKDAARSFMEIIPGGDGAGLIRFDHDAYPVGDATWPGKDITRIVSDDDFDAERIACIAAVNAHATNLAGNTSVGDGVEMARGYLTAVPAADYTYKAMVVFTDGLQTAAKSIEEVAGSIDNRTYAIGLGNELQVDTGALNLLTNGTGGYLLLTGLLSASIDDFFRTKKYFLQILAGVTNDNVVLDPNGYLAPGVMVKIPFYLNETDINCSAILLTDYPVIDFAIETPAGNLILPANAAAMGITYKKSTSSGLYRFTLPVAFGSGEHSGNWKVVLKINDDLFKKQINALREKKQDVGSFSKHGARYSVTISTRSNLKMTVRLDQSSLNPGATITLKASLLEYGIPVANRASVQVEITRPDLSAIELPLSEREAGGFQNVFIADQHGIYRCRFLAKGATLRGKPFNREETRNAAVFIPGKGTGLPQGDGNNQPGNNVKDKCCQKTNTGIRIGLLLLFLILLMLFMIWRRG
jgi:hypothetical protein